MKVECVSNFRILMRISVGRRANSLVWTGRTVIVGAAVAAIRGVLGRCGTAGGGFEGDGRYFGA